MQALLYCRKPNKPKNRTSRVAGGVQFAAAFSTALCLNFARAQHLPDVTNLPSNAAPACEHPQPSDISQVADNSHAIDTPNPCPPPMRLRTLLALRCQNTQDALCTKLTQDKRHLSKTERIELRHALREYARQAGMHRHKSKNNKP